MIPYYEDDEVRRDATPLDWVRAHAERLGFDPDVFATAAQARIDQAQAWQRQATRGNCEHEWMEFGGPGDEWRECFLCGLQEDA